MRGFVATTDFEWFTLLGAIEPPIDEVNFWKPGSRTGFVALTPGEPVFFKLKAPHNAIGGFGYLRISPDCLSRWSGRCTAKPMVRDRTRRCASDSCASGVTG
jgi:hypothetical protein